MKHLVLGGARSGKSRYAQQLAVQSGLPVIYVATAAAGDTEMAARIAQHQQQRPAHWQLIEEQIHLAEVLQTHDAPDRIILVDCLTLWLSNLLCAGDDKQFTDECEKLLAVIPPLQCTLLMVSNEVGQGVVPANELARRFVDEAGWLHQQLAEICHQVTFMVAGIPQKIKK